jgi:ubiquinone/menaquinone biosynthesis C-methylase UbiE
MMANNRNDVYQTYENIAGWYDQQRSRDLFEKAWLDKAIALLPQEPKVLDLGCGMGEPMVPYFVEKGCEVTGVDSSDKLIALAKKRYPEIEFIISDMRNLDLKKKFDLVIAWHSFFHLSQNDQRKMFKPFQVHLKTGGVLMFTTGTEAGELWSDNGGQELYHASLSPEEYKNLLKLHGFELIDHTISDPECGGATVWLARLS